MEYDVGNYTRKLEFEVGSILQSNLDSDGVVYVIISMPSMGSYGLLSLDDLEIVDYDKSIPDLINNYLVDGFAVLKQVEPIKLTKEV
jgi:hypothetical protein